MKGKLSDIIKEENAPEKFQLKHFLQLIRFNNLAMLAFIQILFSVVFAFKNDYRHFLLGFSYLSLVLLIVATVLLAAAGNLINDFFDVKADKINKPQKVIVGKFISKKATLRIYYILNFLGVLSGIVLAFIHYKISYGLLFIAIAIVLFYYSKSFKKIGLLGNFIVSFFIALSILLLLIFPPFVKISFGGENNIVSTIIAYSFFAFLLNFIREIVKDVEDIDGDYIQNRKTLAILIGRKRTQNIIFYVTIIPFILIILLVSNINNTLLMAYSIIFLIIPLGYFMYQIKEVKSKKQFHKLSTLLKIIMLFGMLSVIFFR